MGLGEQVGQTDDGKNPMAHALRRSLDVGHPAAAVAREEDDRLFPTQVAHGHSTFLPARIKAVA